jgi:di/tricarboxylate transporter
MPLGLPLMFVAVVLLFAARSPTDRYLDAFATAYKRLPRGREWLTTRDSRPEIERLRRIAVALRLGAFVLFLAGAVLVVARAR